MNIYKDAFSLLQYIDKCGTVTYGDLKKQFPSKDIFRLFSTLCAERAVHWEHVTSITPSGRKTSNYVSDDTRISCTDAGKTYVEVRRAQNRDRWFTRLIAIWGGITGTAAIIVETVLHFL